MAAFIASFFEYLKTMIILAILAFAGMMTRSLRPCGFSREENKGPAGIG